MTDSVSIAEFIRAIEKLPSDAPNPDSGVWYATQKEHWLGWLNEYDGPGGYGRKGGAGRDARYAYNHIVNPDMLEWLIGAAGVDPDSLDQSLLDAVDELDEAGAPPQQIAAAIRRAVPWETVAVALWGGAAP